MRERITDPFRRYFASENSDIQEQLDPLARDYQICLQYGDDEGVRMMIREAVRVKVRARNWEVIDGEKSPMDPQIYVRPEFEVIEGGLSQAPVIKPASA